MLTGHYVRVLTGTGGTMAAKWSLPVNAGRVETKLDALKNLPHPDEVWTRAEAHERLQDRLRELVEINVIERAESDRRLATYRTDERVYDYIQHLLEKRPSRQIPEMPCGDHGLNNIGGMYDCDYGCGPWTRDEIERYWAGDDDV